MVKREDKFENGYRGCARGDLTSRMSKFEVMTGVRQVNVLSHILFILVMDQVLKQATTKVAGGNHSDTWHTQTMSGSSLVQHQSSGPSRGGGEGGKFSQAPRRLGGPALLKNTENGGGLFLT